MFPHNSQKYLHLVLVYHRPGEHGILEDISAQWDLFLANTFSLKELQQLDFSKVKLPIEWFEGWLKELT